MQEVILESVQIQLEVIVEFLNVRLKSVGFKYKKSSRWNGSSQVLHQATRNRFAAMLDYVVLKLQ